MASDDEFLKIFDTSGIKHGRRHIQRERHEFLCTIIEKNPPIRHNHILRLVKIFDAMAKRTAEKALKNLENLFQITQEGYNYKYYEMKPRIKQEKLKNLIKSFLNETEEIIEFLEKKYPGFSFFKGTQAVALLLHHLYSLYPLIVIPEKIFTYTAFKKQKISFEKLIQRTYNIIEKKRDSVFVYMYFISYLNKEDKIEKELKSLLKELKSR